MYYVITTLLPHISLSTNNQKRRQSSFPVLFFGFGPENVSGARFYTFSVDPQEVLTDLQVHVLLWLFSKHSFAPFLGQKQNFQLKKC